MALSRRLLLWLLLICLGCSAQSVPADLTQRIERQVRSAYSLPSDVKVMLGPIKASEFPNYDSLEITLDNGQKKQQYDFLLSKDRKTLLRLNKLDLSTDPYAEVMKKIDVNGRPTRGNKAAKVVIVNYDDFQCPFCSRMHQTLFPDLLREYGDRVVFIYKDYPLSEIHPWAIHAAVNANCLATLNNDAYWGFADYTHAHQKDINSEKGRDSQFAALDRIALQQAQQKNVDAAKVQSCIKAQNEDTIKASIHEAETLGVQATPTLFVNGEKVDGALPIEELRAVINRALEGAGVTPPTHSDASPASSASSGK